MHKNYQNIFKHNEYGSVSEIHDVQWQIPPLLSALGKYQLHILLSLHTLTLTFPPVSRLISVLSGC